MLQVCLLAAGRYFPADVMTAFAATRVSLFDDGRHRYRVNRATMFVLKSAIFATTSRLRCRSSYASKVAELRGRADGSPRPSMKY